MRAPSLLKLGDEDEILDPVSTPPYDPSKDRVYVLSIRTSTTSRSGKLEFYFVKGPPDYDPSKDGPLEMSVPKVGDGGRIVLQLDPFWNWHFREIGKQITLGRQVAPPSSAALDRYKYLRPAPTPNCMEVSFYASFLNDTNEWNKKNRDPINIYVDFDQSALPDGTKIGPLSIKIDPDIRNPGDPP